MTPQEAVALLCEWELGVPSYRNMCNTLPALRKVIEEQQEELEFLRWRGGNDERAAKALREMYEEARVKVEDQQREIERLRERVSLFGGENAKLRDEIAVADKRRECEAACRRAFVDRVAEALALADQWSQFDGDHHKAWCIDQMVRVLTGSEDEYERFVTRHKTGEDGPDTYGWDEGCPP